MSVKELQKKIKEASDAYYNDEQIMEDEEFDELVERLRELDPENPIFKDNRSTYQKRCCQSKTSVPYG